ncbi:MAG: YggT family protein [Clostridiales Family XIII bacterium]|jgi:YggT family protein|nr:YggT family protein [Clostridiales Family XIII bacterium]
MGAYFAATVVSWVCNILTLILVVRSVLSWIVYSGNQYNRTLHRIYDVLGQITEPLVAPVRRLLSRFVRTGPIDFAPMATFILIIIVRRIVVAILLAIAY